MSVPQRWYVSTLKARNGADLKADYVLGSAYDFMRRERDALSAALDLLNKLTAESNAQLWQELDTARARVAALEAAMRKIEADKGGPSFDAATAHYAEGAKLVMDRHRDIARAALKAQQLETDSNHGP